MFGDLPEVERRLAADPSAATRKAGTLGWEPILYLAYGRLPLPAAAGNAVAIAERLFRCGADPAARFDDGWGNPFTLLTGIIGLGEGVRPMHPRVADLAPAFLDAGTDPFDTQVLYDTSIAGDTAFWLKALYKRSVERGDAHRWTEVPKNPRIGGIMGMSAVDYLLGNAVSYNHIARAEWLIGHGANPNGVNAYSKIPHHVGAQVAGFSDMADLLVKLGAKPVALGGQMSFVAASARGDLAEIRRLAKENPGYLRHPGPLIQAASRNDVAVIDLLLSLGADVDRPGSQGFRAIHNAGQFGSADAAKRLIEAGADLNTRGSNYHASPLGSAVFWNQPAVIDLLVPHSRDLFALSRIARLDRLAAAAAEDPALVHERIPDTGDTPLFALPDDEDAAEAVTRILLVHGADPKATNLAGDTAEAAARKRGLDDAADLMRNWPRHIQ